MKTTFSSLLGFLCLWSIPTAARLLGKSDKDKDHDYDYDYHGSGGYHGGTSKGGFEYEYEYEYDYDKDYHGSGWYGDHDYDYDYDKDYHGKGDSSDEDHGSVDFHGGYYSNGEMDYGYVVAKDLWKNGYGKYDCDNIIHKYWNDVRKIVFPECEYNWNNMFWPDKSHDCKLGAEEFTMKKIGECFGTDECYHLGVGAAASVAGSFCNRNGLFKERDWLPRKCRKHSAVSCKCDAVNSIEHFKKNGACSDMKGSALDYVDKIHAMCEKEIDEMEREAELPWY